MSATPVLRLELKRVDLAERVLGDPLLRASPIVRALGEEVVAALLREVRGRRYVDGARLFAEGADGDTLLWILKGMVRLTGKDGLEVGVTAPGEVVGEGTLLNACPRVFCAQASGECEVLEIPRALLLPHLTEGSPLRTHLEAVHASRTSASAEMADFLDRW